jgi:hypothetical protein
MTDYRGSVRFTANPFSPNRLSTWRVFVNWRKGRRVLYRCWCSGRMSIQPDKDGSYDKNNQHNDQTWYPYTTFLRRKVGVVIGHQSSPVLVASLRGPRPVHGYRKQHQICAALVNPRTRQPTGRAMLTANRR